MHGIVFHELEKFVTDVLGEGSWPKLLAAAKMPDRTFDAMEAYPDADALALVGAAVEITGLEANDILEKFGAFIAPNLAQTFWSLVKPEWTALDLLENTEKAIHDVVRLQNPKAEPPTLRAERKSPTEVVIRYASPRKMCALARGIVRGVGGHFKEELVIDEPKCMHRGDAECELVIKSQS